MNPTPGRPHAPYPAQVIANPFGSNAIMLFHVTEEGGIDLARSPLDESDKQSTFTPRWKWRPMPTSSTRQPWIAASPINPFSGVRRARRGRGRAMLRFVA